MNFKKLMIIKSLVCLSFGIILLALPDKLFSVFGAALSAGGMFTAREYGAALFGNMFLCWYAKDVQESEAKRAIIIALFAYDLIGVVVTTMTVIAGVLNTLGWLIVLIYLFFTVGFGYFFFKVPALKTA